MTNSITRAATVAALAAGAFMLPATADARPTCGDGDVPCPQPSLPVAHVGKFNGGKKPFVNVRATPSTQATLVRRVRSGARALIVCQTTGGVARGPYGRSTLWNKLKKGGYVSDTRVYTGSDGRIAPDCDTGATPPPAANDPFRYDDAGPYNGGAGCTKGHTPGALAIKAWIQRKFRFSSSIGGFSCRPNSADPSRTSLHGVGRALDWMANAGVPAQRKAVDRFVARVLRNNARLGRAMGIQELIWNHRIWTVNHRYWRSYTGPSPHTDHIHIGINLLGARKQTSFFQR